MAPTSSKAISLIGCMFDESDVDKVIAALDAPTKLQRETLAAKRDAIQRQLTSPKKRKKQAADDEAPSDLSVKLDEMDVRNSEREVESINRDIQRLRPEVTATNVWGEGFNVESLKQLWEYVGKRELKKIEVRSPLVFGYAERQLRDGFRKLVSLRKSLSGVRTDRPGAFD